MTLSGYAGQPDSISMQTDERSEGTCPRAAPVLNWETNLQGPESQGQRQFLPSPKQGEHRTCRVRAKQSLFQGYFVVIFVPTRDPRGGDERTSEHKLIKDGSAPTPARQRAIMFGFRFRVTELVLNSGPPWSCVRLR